jgi:hypothetical protein
MHACIALFEATFEAGCLDASIGKQHGLRMHVKLSYPIRSVQVQVLRPFCNAAAIIRGCSRGGKITIIWSATQKLATKNNAGATRVSWTIVNPILDRRRIRHFGP